MRKLTLEEVGRLAGVSRATVSRVVNNPASVTPELRERVQRVIAETGYQPNLAARSLASRRSNIIGLVIPSVVSTLFTDPYFPSLILGISHACNAHDYTLSLFLFHTPQEEQRVYQRALGTGLMAGLIITAEQIDSPFLAQLIEQEYPFVHIGRPKNPNRVNYVDVDNFRGGYLAARHLIELGYQRIATIAGPLNTAAGLDRHAGYVKALEDHHFSVDKKLMVSGDFTRESGYRAMQKLLPHQPQAVFVATDVMALGAIQSIRDNGLDVPGDIGIIGFDDLPHALTAIPPLTTIHQPVHRLGQTAVETLLDIFENGLEPPRQTILPVELIVRGTCRVSGPE
jgi:LacI family transcriptional regulator